MNVATIREFTRNPYSYLSELPLRVTKRNKTAFYIVATLENVATNNVTTPKNVVTSRPTTKDVVKATFNPVPKPKPKGKGIGYGKKK